MAETSGGGRRSSMALRRRRIVVARPPSSVSSSSGGASSSLAASRSLLHRLLRPKRRSSPVVGRFLAASVDEEEEEDEDEDEAKRRGEPPNSQRHASARRGKRIQLQRFVPAQELVDEADFCLYVALPGTLSSAELELELGSDHELDADAEREPYEDAELQRLRAQRERAASRAAAIESAHTAVQLAVLLLRRAGASASLYPLRSRDSEVLAHSRDDTRAYVVTIAAPTLADTPATRCRTSPKPSLPPLLKLADWVRRHPVFAQQVLPLRGAAQSQQLARLIATECPVERDVCLADGTRVLVGGQPLLHQLKQRSDMQVELFPLHRDDQRRSLVACWREDPTLALPLADIHAYFGPKIGMYFAWLTFYTKMLMLPTVIGVLVFVLGLLNAQSYCLHSFVLAIGTSVFVDRWRRRQREIEYLWQYQPPPASVVNLESLDSSLPQGQVHAAPHTTNCSHCDNSGYLETRAGFRAERMLDPVTRREVFGFPHHKRLFRQLLALPLLLIMCCVVGAYVVGLHMLSDQLRASYSDCYKSYSDDIDHTTGDGGDGMDESGMSTTACGVITHGPGMLNALIIYLMDLLYQLLARKLNDFENYRTEAEYEDHLVIKRMPFHFVNSNASLWFLAFYVQSLDRVRDRLWILMVATQVIDNLKEVALPYVVSLVSQLRTATATATANHSRRRRRSIRRRSHRSRSRPRVKSIGHEDDSSSDSEGNDTVDDSGSPEELRQHRRRRRSSVSDSAVRDRLARILTQRRQAQYADTFADYKELMVQYSYVTLYSPIFPLAPAFALVNNMIESRSDFVKLANSHGYQRPSAKHTRGIGVWEKVLVSASVVAVVVNCALVYTYELNDLLPTWSSLERFMFVVGCEHVIFLIKAGLNWASPDLPAWIQHEQRAAQNATFSSAGVEPLGSPVVATTEEAPHPPVEAPQPTVSSKSAREVQDESEVPGSNLRWRRFSAGGRDRFAEEQPSACFAVAS